MTPIRNCSRTTFAAWVSTSWLLCVLTAPAVFAAGTAAPTAMRTGQPITGSAGVRQTMAEIMRLEALHPSTEAVQPTLVPEFEGPDRGGLPQNPASPRVGSIPSMAPEKMVGSSPSRFGIQPLSPQTVGTNFLAATLSGTNPTNAFPPDCNGAVGPTQYIVALNGRIVSFNKTTGVADGVVNTTTNTFFTSVRNGSGTSDPMIRYDRLSSRWFISIINVSAPNRWLLGVSDAASNGVISAGTVWTYYFFVPATTTPSIGTDILSDYPSLGIDANALYTGVDEFTNSTGAFLQTDVFVIRKTSVLSGGPIVVTAFRSLMSASSSYVGPFAPRGVDNYDPSSNEGYFIGTDGASYGTFWLNRVANPGGTPSLSANIQITLPTTNGPRPTPHLGNTGGYFGRVDALDDRPFQAYIRNQQLWTAHNIAVDNTGVSEGTYLGDTRTGSRWYQFNVPVGSGTPTITQMGTVFTASASNDSLQRYYFIPSITVSGQGHAAMGFSTSGESERINCGTVGRLSSDALGTMETPVLYTGSSTAYNPTGDPGGGGRPRRWGDYSITNVDPLDDMSMWTVQMFCNAANSYGVQVAKLIAPLPATPSAMADVATGQSAVSVTLTGTSASGSGFFDPGANLPSPARAFTHLAAAITNGSATGTPPTVVSATYVNPTTVNLVLNTTSATANLTGEKYTITITNPDGQTAAAAVVHVIPNVTYTITASAGSGGSIAPSGAVVVGSGASQTFTITPSACFAVNDVQVDNVSVGAVTSYTFTNVQTNHTISASFVALGPYTITSSAGAHGSISPSDPQTVACGNNLTYTITPDACFHVAIVHADGVSLGAPTSYTFTNVQTNHTIDASFAADPPPAAVSALSAAQVKTGNDGSGTTRVTLTFTPPGGAASVEVWRAGFGNYPSYAGGGAPTAPGSYPPVGWTLTGVTASGQADQPATRDYWYYVAYAKDACGNPGAVSNVAGGVLDYHLGDVSDGTTPGQGDNSVSIADVSLLGSHYGASGPSLTGYEYLDVGPTLDNSTNGRPSPDGTVDFEDMVMYALNFAPQVSIPHRAPASSGGSGGANTLALKAPFVVNAGDVIEVPVELSAAGDLQALSVALDWDAAVVQPIATTPGDFVTSQGGLVLSPKPGKIDAAMLGAGRALDGSGVLATVRFRALADGDPRLALGKVVGRNGGNQPVTIRSVDPLALQGPVTTTALAAAIPNPTHGTTVLQYSLARPGNVQLAIYSVDGRRVRTLASGVQGVGRYRLTWNGADDHGTPMKSGLYFARLEAAGIQKTRLISIVR